MVNLNQIKKNLKDWQVVLGLLHWVAAFSIAGYAQDQGKDWKTFVYYEYNVWVGKTSRSCGSGDGCMIYPVKERVDSENQVSLIWAAASFSLISGSHHLLSWTYWNRYYEKCVKDGFNWARWIDYGASSGLMFAIISILFNAPPDLNTLVLSFTVQTLVIATGAASEALWSKKEKTLAWVFFLVSGAIFLVPWVSLFIIFGTANNANPTEDSCGVPFPEGTEKKGAPDFVWGAIVGLFVTFASFAVCHACKIWETPSERVHLKYEYVYGFLSFTSKIILLGNIGSGIIARSSNNVKTKDQFNYPNGIKTFFDEDQEDDDEDMLFWYFFIGSVVTSLALGVAMLIYKGRQTFGNIKDTTKAVTEKLIF